MAKGRIVDSIGDGQYRVKLLYAYEKVQQELSEIASRLAELTIAIPEQKLALSDLEQALSELEGQIDNLIPQLSSSPEETRSKIEDLQKDMAKVGGDAAVKRREVAQLVTEDLALRKRQNLLTSLPTEEVLDAWCADYSPNLNGDVGLVIVNDEGGGDVLIHPGFQDAAVYNPARDGQLMSREAQSGSQIFFNAAILPGVQKWRPRYRLGRITSIDGDTCNVRLDAAVSSAQGLDINQSTDLVDVPIQYMECNGDAFESGDRVLLRFFSVGPQVIGFEGNPRPCVLLGIYMVPTFAVGFSVGQTYGEPFFDEFGDPINPPLGDAGGTNPAWGLRPGDASDEYSITKAVSAAVAGNQNWIQQGGSGLVLSWHGPTSRFFEFYKETLAYGWHLYWGLDTKVFCKLSVIVDMQDYAGAIGSRLVVGAASDATTDPASLYVVTVNDESLGPEFKLWHFDLQTDYTVGPIATLVHVYQAPADTMFCSGFYFDGTGRNAVCTLRSYYVNDPAKTDRERVYALRLAVSSGFSIETIYDADDGQNENFITTSAVGGADAELDQVTVELSRDIPIYVDYSGVEEITIFHRVPQITDVRDFDYLREVDGNIEQVTSQDNTYKTTEDYERIVTSKGDVLAEIPILVNNYNNLQNSSYKDYEAFEFSYSMALDIHREARNANLNFEHLVVNGRDQFVAVAYTKFTFDGRWSRVGENQDNDLEGSNSPGNIPDIILFLEQGSETIDWYLDVWVAGEKVSGQHLEAITTSVTTNRGVSEARFEPYFVDIPLNTSYIGKPTATEIFSSQMQDAAMVRSQNRVAVSVLFFDSQGIPHKYQDLDGVGDPAGSIFGQQPSDPYIMHRLTLY